MKRPIGARRLLELPAYAFAEIDARAAELRAQRISVIDFGVGDPTTPTPGPIRRACRDGVERYADAGYPAYAGSPFFRRAAARWLEQRFGVSLSPETEVTATIGSKEAVFHLPAALVDPGDVVLLPSPGYPPYAVGTRFAEATPVAYGLWREHGFLPDLESIPAEVLARARLLWVNYPNSPTGACATRDELARLAEFARRHDLLLASDEAYVDLWFGTTPAPSMLEVARERVIAFFSLSKRSAMTGYRVGFAAGDPELVGALRRLKTNLDSGTPTFVQAAAAEALADEGHVEEMREEYRRKRDVLCESLESLGLPPARPAGTIYVWQPLPEGLDDREAARRLLSPEIAVVATPGSLIARPLDDGRNPGAGHLRFALVPTEADVRQAAARLTRTAWLTA
ncbi:MAG: aminotransferase class I/II-fold pyridoxal phosphate-dependent enzyme [Deltaproteobacteria bacterium]|nr:aminotransferase class I/II-fold pyridoxal phosphate-dependent enzyme [Deltaproteobacteria bacterium]